MDREINERAVISTGAQRQEVFHSDGGAAKLSTAVLSARVCEFAHCTSVCVHACVCAFACLCLDNRKKETNKEQRDVETCVSVKQQLT